MALSEFFRFRFVARGDLASRGVQCAITSLRRCQPKAEIVLVDANDQPCVELRELADARCAIIHVRPDPDEVAAGVGRGSQHHLFYWRHSPQVLAALPPTSARYDVHADADILLLRPMDLAALAPHLDAGCIAAGIDWASPQYFNWLERESARDWDDYIFPYTGTRGPLIQGGLVFTNLSNDGALYARFWELACKAASGELPKFPWGDAVIMSALLGHGGPLFGRLLPLGHEWNFISTRKKDGGVFGYVAHYGAPSHDKEYMIGRFPELYPSTPSHDDLALWQREPDVVRVGYGRVGLEGASGHDATPVIVGGHRRSDTLSVVPPFSLTWIVPPGAEAFEFSPSFDDTGRRRGRNPPVTIYAYVDGHFVARASVIEALGGDLRIPLERGETVTLVATTRRRAFGHFLLVAPRWKMASTKWHA